MRLFLPSLVLALFLVPASSFAQVVDEPPSPTPIADAARAAGEELAVEQQPAAAPPPVAVEYSRGYEIRRKIHVYASVATLPLFATEIVLGQKIYDGDASSGMKSAHGAVAGGIAALFGVNTITGVWNLIEAKKDPHGRGRRLLHGLMMLGADAGFAATGALAPDDENDSNKSLHRTVALTSIGVAATSYLVMLFTR